MYKNLAFFFITLFLATACKPKEAENKSDRVANCIRFNSIWDRNLDTIEPLLKAYDSKKLTDSEKEKLINSLASITAIKYQYQYNRCTKHDAQKGYFDLHVAVNKVVN